MASVNVGDTVYYNESNDGNPSWCVATVVQTDTVPSADAVQAIIDDTNFGGNYPPIPDDGNINIAFWAMAGNSGPQPYWANNVPEGTGPRQWTTEAPSY
jgi:hypothetical protein